MGSNNIKLEKAMKAASRLCNAAEMIEQVRRDCFRDNSGKMSLEKSQEWIFDNYALVNNFMWECAQMLEDQIDSINDYLDEMSINSSGGDN